MFWHFFNNFFSLCALIPAAHLDLVLYLCAKATEDTNTQKFTFSFVEFLNSLNIFAPFGLLLNLSKQHLNWTLTCSQELLHTEIKYLHAGEIIIMFYREVVTSNDLQFKKCDAYRSSLQCLLFVCLKSEDSVENIQSFHSEHKCIKWTYRQLWSDQTDDRNTTRDQSSARA